MGYAFNSLSSYIGDVDDPSPEYVEACKKKLKQQEKDAAKWRKNRDQKAEEGRESEDHATGEHDDLA